jgi:stalled ribosome rescue protein Dom34
MNGHYHAIVWIDHQQAKIFQFDATDVDSTVVRSSHPHQHIHHKANSGDSGHAPVDKAFLKQVAENLANAGTILITGPANAKQELRAYLAENQPAIAARIAGVEPLDHPTDGELLNLARTFFKAADRMRSQLRRGIHE